VGDFGDKFRRERESKKITLEDVSNATKISSRMLQAIEDEKFDLLPGGVFNKGFIRAYAKHLGINDEEAVSEYLACLRKAQIAAQAVWDPLTHTLTADKRPAAAAEGRNGGTAAPPPEELPELHLPRAEDLHPLRQKYLHPPEGIPWRLVAMALVVAVLLSLLWRRHARNSAENSSPRPAIQVVQAGQPAASNQAAGPAIPDSALRVNPPATTASTATTNKPPSQTAGKPSPPGKTAANNPATSSSSAGNVSSGNTNSSGPKLPASAAASLAAFPLKPDAYGETTIPPAPALIPDETATKPLPLTLVIRASENSWISVTADGQAVSQETLIAPANTSVHASREIVAKVGNAAGVTFLWNGKEIPAQGNEAEVKTIIFDAEGVRVLTPNQVPVQLR